MSKTNILTQQIYGGNLVTVDSVAVAGGTLYMAGIMNGGVQQGISAVFVPTGASSPQRFLALSHAVSDLGVPMTAAAGTPSGTVGISRTAGTSLQLLGEVTSSNAKTNKALFEFNLPDSYVAGTNIPVTVNAVAAGSGTLTAVSTTMTVAAYTEKNGVEAALTVTAAVQIPPTTAADLSFTITGTNLIPGQHLALELVMLVTSASGANTGTINSVSYQA
jgi:hypothetical protein